MWKVILNENYDENDPDSPKFFVCNGEKCYPADSKEDADDLCKKLNEDPNFKPEKPSVPQEDINVPILPENAPGNAPDPDPDPDGPKP